MEELAGEARVLRLRFSAKFGGGPECEPARPAAMLKPAEIETWEGRKDWGRAEGQNARTGWALSLPLKIA